MQNNKIKLNKNCVNAAIVAHILPDEEMRDIGFSDYSKDRWYLCKQVNFPKEKKYKGFEITFNLSIPKDGSDIRIDVLDEDFCQPYDYQRLLEHNPDLEPAKIIFEFVENEMKRLEDRGVLSGHKYGEYI